MYNYFIRMSDRKVHKYPEKMQWMNSDIFSKWLLELKEKFPKVRFRESWRSKDGKKSRNNKRAKFSSKRK